MANSISTGVAYADPSFQSLNVTGATTLDGNVMIGDGVADTVGHYGVTAISQRASSLQATSLLSSSTDFTAAHVNALKEVMNTLTALGLWKGSA